MARLRAGRVKIYNVKTPHFWLREASLHQNGWIFGKVPNGGGVISNPKNFVANLRFAEIISWIGWGTTFDLRKAEISETH